MYGPVAEEVAAEVAIPLYAPDDSAFLAALESPYDRILILASAKGPLDDAVQRFTQAAAEAGRKIAVTGSVADGALAAASAGNDALLARRLQGACGEQRSEYDAVLLARYSLSPAAEALSGVIRKPVLAGPKLAAAALGSLLLHGSTPANPGRRGNA
jgi:hypothetical protein